MVKKKKTYLVSPGRPKTTVKEKLSKITFNFDSFAEILKKNPTEKELCKILRISTQTLHMWKQDYEFMTILRENRETANEPVELSAFKRSVGYDYWEEEHERIFNKKNKKWEMVCVKRRLKHMPADTGAMIFYLSNRLPKKWKRSMNSQEGNERPPAVYVMPVFNNSLLISDEQQKEIKQITDPKSADVKFKEIPKLKITNK